LKKLDIEKARFLETAFVASAALLVVSSGSWNEFANKLAPDQI
jgi:hypothetical protein